MTPRAGFGTLADVHRITNFSVCRGGRMDARAGVPYRYRRDISLPVTSTGETDLAGERLNRSQAEMQWHLMIYTPRPGGGLHHHYAPNRMHHRLDP